MDQKKLTDKILKNKIFSFSKKTYYLIFFVLVIILIFFMAFSGKKTEEGNYTVERMDINRSILATGQVKSGFDINLSTTVSGVVKNINVDVGDNVSRGDILLTLDTGTLLAERTKALSDVLLKSAQNKNTVSSLETIISQQETFVENAFNKMLSDGLVARPSSENYTQTPPVITGLYDGDEGEYKILLERDNSGTNFEIRTFGIERTVNEIDKQSATPLGTKGLFISFPDGYENYDDTIWYVDIPNTKSSSYGTNYNAYQEALRLKDKAILEARQNLENTTSGGSIADVELQKAQAELQRIDAEIAKYTIRAPEDGTITSIDVSVGELVALNEKIIRLEDLGALYIEADVNESVATNVSVGQKVILTYDAFGENQERMGTVSFVDPSATIIDNIVNYTVKITTEDLAGVKPGMTANLSIVTGSLFDVIAIPGRLIIQEDGKDFVLIQNEDGKMERREIVVGLRADGNMVEIKEGLSSGEIVSASK